MVHGGRLDGPYTAPSSPFVIRASFVLSAMRAGARVTPLAPATRTLTLTFSD